jgi:hypothetical protein
MLYKYNNNKRIKVIFFLIDYFDVL